MEFLYTNVVHMGEHINLCQNANIAKWFKMWDVQAEHKGASLDMLQWATFPCFYVL